MKFTLSWLKEHLDTDADVKTVAETLTAIGLEVEAITDRAAILAPFTVAEVIEATPHPNADKLRLCTVEAGDDKPYQVVCGAPNARAGIKVVFARMGTTIPVNGMILKPAQIRGADSQGMMCSMREMGLGEDHDGIIELPADALIGKPFAEVLGLADPIIEIAVTPNRQDCLGVAGIARDLAAAGLGTLKTPPVEKIPGSGPSPFTVTLAASVADQACPIFAGRVIRGVKNGPSPAWLKQKLEAIGLRPISTLVDITNVLTYDRNRPLHVFDAAKLDTGIVVRLGKTGESIAGLDGKTYALDETMVAVCDHSTVLGLGGIIGGVPSSVTDETTDVFVECAWFDPYAIAAAGRKLGVNTDARHRFERGVDPTSAVDGLEHATRLILDLCGGAASEIVVAGKAPDAFCDQSFRPARVKQLTGLEVTEDEMAAILTRLGFTVTRGQPTWTVAVPPWRRDIAGEADLIEEVARITGLDKLPVEPLPGRPVVARPALDPKQKRVRLARRLLATRGLIETINDSFVPEAHAVAFGWSDPALKVVNPISVELAVMRPSLIPSLAQVAARNGARGMSDIAIFELAGTYHGIAPSDQMATAGGLRSGFTAPRHWQKTRRPVDAFDAKADLLALLGEIGAPSGNLTVETIVPGWLHPGQAGAVKLGPKTVLGVFGALHPKTAKRFGLDGPIVVFEAYLDRLPLTKARPTREKGGLKLSDFQAVERDFAFLVDQDLPAGTLMRAVKGADKQLITDVSVFDRYTGPGTPEGKASLALSVRLEPTDRTLTDAEIEEISAKIVIAGAKLGAELRR